ncbi:MAG: hypothetical protein MJE63_06280, partial [Proteobacteria bacterium]|nr:hypothetical protein [Pseudomonadota bacterium]
MKDPTTINKRRRDLSIKSQKTAKNHMQIDYLDHLNDHLLFPAVELYFNSLKEKLEPILGSDERAKKLLAKSVAAD